MHSVSGLTVVITGGAMGMGKLYAQRAVAENAASVVLLDVNPDALAATAKELAGDHSGTAVHSYVVDLSSREDIASVATLIRSEVGDPDVLINNAGIIRSSMFWDHDPAMDIELTMKVNTLAAMYLSHAFLPAMIAKSTESRILNIASAAGTVSNPRMSVYAASKWAMIGWSDSLRLELVKAGHPQVKVTTFAPSYISTGMFAGARGPLMTPIMTPEKASTAAWNAMLKGKPLLMKPWTVGLGRTLKGLLPTRAWDVVAGRIFKVYSSMDKFTGRDQPPRDR
ncbi:MAG: SDR family NAD(P)-dependent oxidoreductase [Terrimesophilobacter sp.]